MITFAEYLRLAFGYFKDMFVFGAVLRINILTTKCIKLNNRYMMKNMDHWSDKKFKRVVWRSFRLLMAHNNRDKFLDNLRNKIEDRISTLDHIMYVYTGRHLV